jgi:hypothetical protein
MAEKRDLASGIGRARHRLLTFAETMPEDVRLDATICINELCDVAEREIEQAYWDGYKQHRLQTQMPKKQLPSTKSSLEAE